jgi:hypothetical protein
MTNVRSAVAVELAESHSRFHLQASKGANQFDGENITGDNDLVNNFFAKNTQCGKNTLFSSAK